MIVPEVPDTYRSFPAGPGIQNINEDKTMYSLLDNYYCIILALTPNPFIPENATPLPVTDNYNFTWNREKQFADDNYYFLSRHLFY